jgi:Lrp/AsnC family transcriptional regulator
MKIDTFDLRLLSLLQRNSTLSQRELADRIGLSQNACWRRLKRLTAEGLLKGTGANINLAALGLDLTVLVMVRTRAHSKDWADRFRKHVERLPEVVDFHRIGGDWDYMIKVVTRGMAGYDAFYQRLITNFDLDRVTGLFSMEAIMENHALDLMRLIPQRATTTEKPRRARATAKASRRSQLLRPR